MAVEPAVDGICRTYADKLVVLCDRASAPLTAWHLKAFNNRDAFVALCAADEAFATMTPDRLTALQTAVNNAGDCAQLRDTL
ncbi:MAG: hypothetical protein HY696_03130 [Deltaproteobacteria bacterium]|nr:hypothetical protein [Deltaproteobacteria bacterium]